jgi:hypothetical protein
MMFTAGKMAAKDLPISEVAVPPLDVAGTATPLHNAGRHRRCCSFIQSDAAHLRRPQMGDV